jgi:hypothetical protein
MKPKFVDQVDITIPLNQADGDVPNLKNYKIGEIKKFFSVSVNNEKLKELKDSLQQCGLPDSQETPYELVNRWTPQQTQLDSMLYQGQFFS